MKKDTVKIGGVHVPASLDKAALLRFLVENKSTLMAEKKATLKEADALTIPVVDLSNRYTVGKEGKLEKAVFDGQVAPEQENSVLVVINTTNWMDSHSDVHIPGIWNKSIKDNQGAFLHLQEHQMKFTHIISDSAEGFVQQMMWKDLGLNIPGVTEALIFRTKFTGRNTYMEDQYKSGHVKNHSVGMRYFKLFLCINEPEDRYYREEFENWEKYAPMVANLSTAEEQGFFWAVTEAGIIEGSAVPRGSNSITPTLEYKSAEPVVTTQPPQPPEGTGSKEEGIDWDKIAKAFVI